MATLPDAVRTLIEADGARVVLRTHAVGGGDTSQAARVETAAGPVFAKWGEGDAGLTYASEADGLAALAAAAPIRMFVPAPIGSSIPDADGPGALVLPWIESGAPDADDWRRFGAALADLHHAPAPGDAFGWRADNWIGSKPQQNSWLADWPAFFAERRLLAQREVVRIRGSWDAAWDGTLDRLAARLPEFLPATPPRSLVHGDLWAGNALPMRDGRFALIDPAVYIGHREVDLAMTELFGGFPPAFYDGYREARPLEPGYAERREIYNLFHLINHLTHGPQYRAPVEATLRRFS